MPMSERKGGTPQTRIKELEKLLAEANAKLELSNKELESFSYSVSHDLRAPLRAIDGFTRILIDDYAGALDPEGKRFLTYVETNAQQLGRLMDDLLGYYRLSKAHLNKTTLDTNELIRVVIAETTLAQPVEGADFRVESLEPAYGDPVLLRQAFGQLISNAIKFRGEKKLVVRVRSESTPHETIYSVGDNGRGFDMQYANKLFKVFQKLQRAEDASGNGIGLAIVQRIATRHGGRVWAEATPQKGATFFLALPKQSES